MRYLVTGGAGFIGSTLVERLLADGHEVVSLDNYYLGRPENYASFKSKQLKVVKADIRDSKALLKATAGVDGVFHESGLSSAPMFEPDPSEGYDVNVLGFVRLLNACVANNVREVVFASSSSIYGDARIQREDAQVSPPNFYSATKYAMEDIARLYSAQQGLRVRGLRYFSVYGPREEHKTRYANLISQFYWAMRDSQEIIVYGDGAQTRDFTFVSDIVEANVLAMKAAAGVYNVGTGKTHSINEMIEMMAKKMGVRPSMQYIENPIKDYVQDTRADTRKAEKELGFRAKVPLDEGIARIVDKQAFISQK